MDTNENIEDKLEKKKTVKEYIDELKKVLNDPEAISYEDAKTYMDITYEAISLNASAMPEQIEKPLTIAHSLVLYGYE
jgi:hypothetical protein